MGEKRRVLAVSGSLRGAMVIQTFFLSVFALRQWGESATVIHAPLFHRFSSDSPWSGPSSTKAYGTWRMRQSVNRGAILLKKLDNEIRGFKEAAGLFSTAQNFPSKAQPVLPLQGGVEELGLYYTIVRLGSQQQQMPVVIDTGSSLLWVECGACDDCQMRGSPYMPELSSSLSKVDCGSCSFVNSETCSGPYSIGCSFDCGPVYRKRNCITGCSVSDTNQCHYVVAYGDQSFTGGQVIRDILTMGTAEDEVSAPVIFGCDTLNTTPAVRAPAAGLMGLAKSHISLPLQLSAAHVLSEDVFAHCLGGEEGNGTLTFGNVTGPNMQFVPMGSDPILYNVSIFEISVGDQNLSLSPSSFGGLGAVVDSGSTAISLPTVVYKALVKELLSNLSKQPSLQQLTEDDINKVAGADVSNILQICFTNTSSIDSPSDVFPPITIFLDGAQLLLQPTNYLWRFDPLFCLGVYDSAETLGASSFTLLGEFALRNRLVVYDQESKRLGFSDFVSCQL